MPVAMVLLCLIALILPTPSAWAQPAAPEAPPDEPEWTLLAPLRVVRLDNGMTFLLYPNDRAPIFSGVIRYDVGGKDEIPTQTGISHMFEHMAFKGTSRLGTTDYAAEQEALAEVERLAYAYDRLRNQLARDDSPTTARLDALRELAMQFQAAQAAAGQYVVKDEFDEIYSREGGSQMNATTSPDATTYFISLPANRLPLWARMESERLADPVPREFYREREVILEERRMRLDNSPLGRLWEITMATAYVAHPYGYPTIGWESDIANLKATEAMAFYRRHYTPDRAVGVLVGQFNPEEAEALLRETFGKLPPAPEDLAEHRIVPEPEQMGERRATLEFPATPALLLAWHKPPAPGKADVAAELLGQIVAGGRSARWFERLVKEERLAAEVHTFTGPGDREPNLFMIYATPQPGHTLDELEAALREEVRRVRTEPVSAEELERARKNLRADTIRALQTNLGLARTLAEYAQIGAPAPGEIDPWYLERRLHQLEGLTAGDLLAFAAEYLTDANLTVGSLTPPPSAEETPPGAGARGGTDSGASEETQGT
ncbi:MAG TPA: pitrilysin family protein [Candidatus Sumerlaeota bacterium]|nr:pitrilysin family protein [Candidatus Sumerlaeota bacterium]HPK01460.1 pitrilysin family protein [Candidatus Sumerlaeota bacterium]